MGVYIYLFIIYIKYNRVSMYEIGVWGKNKRNAHLISEVSNYLL